MEKSSSGSEQELPGFRFHPTEEELLEFYLRRMVHGKKLNFDVIGTLNLYRHDPWDLPKMAKVGEREWYFFVPRDRRQSTGGRPNRTTERGFWKATGSDRHVRSAADPRRLIGIKKTLVFYTGRAPRGTKTDWIMNEYRLPDAATDVHEDIVLCKIYRKATSMKELEQRATMEEKGARASSLINAEMFSSSASLPPSIEEGKTSTASPPPAIEEVKLPQLQIPKYEMGWLQDPFLTQLRSPWMENWSPLANLLNF